MADSKVIPESPVPLGTPDDNIEISEETPVLPTQLTADSTTIDKTVLREALENAPLLFSTKPTWQEIEYFKVKESNWRRKLMMLAV